MSLLDQAAATIESWDTGRKKDRAKAIKLFKQVLGRLDRGIAVWKKFLENAPETGDRFTTVLWIGSRPAKKLHALYLENKATATALTELTGVRFKDSLSLAEDLDVVQPYEQLKPNESGSDRARAAIDTMVDRRQKIEALVTRLEP